MNQETCNYEGCGKTGKTLAKPQTLLSTAKPESYIPESGLCDAIKVALTLGQPLLVTGEPGTGKTQLASSIAYEFQLPDPIVFHTKTSSTAGDLLYHYDALKRFNDAQIEKKIRPVEHYVSLRGLGIAILLSTEYSDQDKALLPAAYQQYRNSRSVVLIDEIDKAPRDFPNDILNEVEKLEFTIHEIPKTITAETGNTPIIILTSNSEKYLPDAFLRRCVFYHINFPDEIRLKRIIEQRFNQSSIHPGFSEEETGAAIKHFESIRLLPLKKKPATAELLAWMTMLKAMNIDIIKPNMELKKTYGVLAKNAEDFGRMVKLLRGIPKKSDLNIPLKRGV
ncbi:MAG: MoxR family ATPase [Candidatus Magnetomorum sp.]|nr:MoxR family ATPase [Candidatus Magnetomorum sp.]